MYSYVFLHLQLAEADLRAKEADKRAEEAEAKATQASERGEWQLSFWKSWCHSLVICAIASVHGHPP